MKKEKEVIQLLLRWYYGYHRAIDAHKVDSGDKSIKPYFLSVYQDTDDLLEILYKDGKIPDKMCGEAYHDAFIMPET